MPSLLTAIVVWLSANFGLPADYQFPRIERMSSVEMTRLRYQSITVDQRQALNVRHARTVQSLYSVQKKTIYLRPEWTGKTPADLSELVHEMVHHLQNLSHAKFACPAESEKLPYEAQEKWLNMFGHSLASDFELDPFTILVVTTCGENGQGGPGYNGSKICHLDRRQRHYLSGAFEGHHHTMWVPTKEEAVDMFARHLEACHRSGAAERAKQRAASLKAKGDQEGHKIWTDVACRVEALRQEDKVALRRAKERT